jgi:hypothetical protein
MKIQSYTHYNMWHVIPALSITYEKNHYLSVDMIWGKWGISLIVKDK